MRQAKHKILVVEDEAPIRRGLVDVLVYHGYQVDAVEDGAQGLDAARSEAYDLVLLDLMLPKVDGFSVCETLREEQPHLAIIMLTARVSDEDIVHGLRLGADDYVAKPFSVEQLVLRVGAVLRRTVGSPESPVKEIKLPTAVVDVTHLQVRRRDTATASLTKRELEVVLYLHQHHDRPVPREELLSAVWGYANTALVETRTVDIHIAKIRKKVEVDAKHPASLVTVRGAGYKLLSQ